MTFRKGTDLLENYQEFLDRINSYRTPELFDTQKCFIPAEGVLEKVNQDGTFRQFYGDTVVFKINPSEQEYASRIAEGLYNNFSDLFAERIGAETYHVTLHDLVSGNDLSQIAMQIFKNELAIIDAFRAYNVSHNPIKMKSAYLLNMVNTSIVLVLTPASEADYEALMQLKRILQIISPLSYPLTPHITLAYFGRSEIDKDKVAALSRLAAELYTESLHFSLHIDDLFYQKFVNMNHYYDIFRIFGNN